MKTIVEVNRGRMREALDANGYSIRDLAAAAGTTVAMTGKVARYARGAIGGASGRYVTEVNAKRLAAALDRPYTALFQHANGDPLCQ